MHRRMHKRYPCRYLPRSSSLYLGGCFGSSVPLVRLVGVFIGNVRFAMYAITFTETRNTPCSAIRAPPNYFSAQPVSLGPSDSPIWRNSKSHGKLAPETGPIPHYYAAVTRIIVYRCQYTPSVYPSFFL